MQPFILLMAITSTILSTLLVFTYPFFEQVTKKSLGSEIWFGAEFGTVYNPTWNCSSEWYEGHQSAMLHRSLPCCYSSWHPPIRPGMQHFQEVESWVTADGCGPMLSRFVPPFQFIP